MHSRVLVIILLILSTFSCSKNSKKIIFIANSEVDCVGVTPQKCLQIKEEGTTDWTIFNDSIAGFDYKKGFFYKLKVDVLEVDNPPADGSSLKYTLIEVLEQSEGPLTLDKGSWFVTYLKQMDSFGRNPFIKIDLSKNEINGNTSCNRFSGKITVIDNHITISDVASTEMMCRDIEVETIFLTALNNTSTYSLKEEKLQLRDDNNEVLMECKYLKSE